MSDFSYLLINLWEFEEKTWHFLTDIFNLEMLKLNERLIRKIVS